MQRIFRSIIKDVAATIRAYPATELALRLIASIVAATLLAVTDQPARAAHAQKGYEHLYPAGDFPHSDIELDYPEEAYPITSRFGDKYGRPPGGKKERRRFRHTGVDIYAPRGTPVVAPAPGRIVATYWRDEGGNTIWMRVNLRGEEISLYFLHLDTVGVAQGQEVAAGQVIGGVGATMEGHEGGGPPHLHFEVTTDEGWYDPAGFLIGEDDRVECVRPGTDYSDRDWTSRDLKMPWLLYPVACNK